MEVTVREARPILRAAVKSHRAISTFKRENPRMSPRSAQARRLNAARMALNEAKWNATNRAKIDAAKRVNDMIAEYGAAGLAVRFNG